MVPLSEKSSKTFCCGGIEIRNYKGRPAYANALVTAI